MKPFTRLVVLPAFALTPLLALPMAARADDSGSPATTAQKGVEITGYLTTLIGRVEASNLGADVKAGLLGRLRAARDAFNAHQPLSNGDVQSLLHDVLGALGQKGGNEPATTKPAPPTPTDAPTGSTEPHNSEPRNSEPHNSEPRTSGPRTSEPSGSSPRSTAPGSTVALDPQQTASQLDEWTTKVNASSLSDGDKAIVLGLIAKLRAGVDAGTVTRRDLEALGKAIKTALEHLGHDGHTSTVPGADGTTVPGDGTSVPGGDTQEAGHPHGAAAIDRAIAAVKNSNLPDALKQQLLDTLNQAKSSLTDPTVTPDQAAEKLKALLEAEKAKRLQEMATKLTSFATKIDALATKAGSVPGADAVVADVHTKVAEAESLLAGPLDVKTLKSAWKLLHDARRELRELVESSTSTTAPATTSPVTTAPDTTVTSTTAAPDTTVGAGMTPA